MAFKDPFNTTLAIFGDQAMNEDEKRLFNKYKKGQVTALLILKKSSPKHEWLKKVVNGYAFRVDERVQSYETGEFVMFFVGKNQKFVSVAGFVKWVNDCEESAINITVRPPHKK